MKDPVETQFSDMERTQWVILGQEFYRSSGNTLAILKQIPDSNRRRFWNQFLALGKKHLQSGALVAFGKLLNNLSQHEIASLPNHLQDEWEKFHNRYLKLAGGTPDSLLTGLHQGSQYAQERLIEQYSPLIESQIRRFFSPDLAEDVKHEVLIEVFEEIKRKPFDRQRLGSFRSYLRTISKRVAIKFQKNEKRHPSSNLGNLGLDHLADQLENRDSRESHEWKEACCRAALERLKTFLKANNGQRRNVERDLEIFLAYTLRNIEGERATAADVAKLFGVSQQVVFNVDIRMRNLLERFRKEVGDDLDFD